MQNGALSIVLPRVCYTVTMPIKVQCACGKAFAAKDELAGKSVKCPNCQQPLKIAAAGSGNNKPATKAVPPSTKPSSANATSATAAPTKAASPAAPAQDDLFDEIGLAPPVEGTKPCPGCAAPMPIEAILCIKCGYNIRIGRRMLTEASSEEAVEGHGAVAQDLLNKAANVIEGDEEAEKSKTTEGLPWWVYLIILIILISIAAAMIMRGGSEEKDEEGKKAAIAIPARQIA
jgi:hypothetical protein